MSFSATASFSASTSASASIAAGGGNGSSTDLMPEQKVLLANKFWIESEGILDAYFTELSGMNIETEVMTVKEGGLNNYVHKLPVRTSYTNVVLKRGLTDSKKFLDWYQKTINGKVERKNITIIQYSAHTEGHPVVKRWELTNAYPVKYQLGSFSAKSNEWSIETMELAYEFFKLAS